MFSPHRCCRRCSAPKPGKQKQKGNDYRCDVLIFHGFDPSFCFFTLLMRKFGREVTRKMVLWGASNGFSGNHGSHGSRNVALKTSGSLTCAGETLSSDSSSPAIRVIRSLPHFAARLTWRIRSPKGGSGFVACAFGGASGRKGPDDLFEARIAPQRIPPRMQMQVAVTQITGDFGDVA